MHTIGTPHRMEPVRVLVLNDPSVPDSPTSSMLLFLGVPRARRRALHGSFVSSSRHV